MGIQECNIECEVRGPITWGDFQAIKKDLEKGWGDLVFSKELVLFATGNQDIRIKISNQSCKLIYKEGVASDNARNENEVNIACSDIPALIRFLHGIGENEWALSFAEKYEARKRNSSITLKFGTRIGDFFEIEELVSEESEITNALGKVKKDASRLGLSLWEKEAFVELTEKAWEHVVPQPLISGNQLHPLVAQTLESIETNSNETTIADLLKKHNNDYSILEKKFFEKLGESLLSNEPLENKETITKHLSKKVSIIIPTYNSSDSLLATLESIEKQDLPTTYLQEGVEVIVVDDGSNDNTKQLIHSFQPSFSLKYLFQNNISRSAARNLGVGNSSNEILIFLDSDVVLDRNFVQEHVIRHKILDHVTLVSFKENIKKEELLDDKLKKKPDFHEDFRFNKRIEKDWLRMHRHVRTVEVREVQIMQETDNLKNFGGDKVVGVWGLPCMVVTSAMSIKRKDFDTVGGFNLQFMGWGMEDTFLGACLISLGNYVVPVFSTGVYHIKHKPRSGSEEKRIKEFNRNVLVYLDLIHRPISSLFKNRL